MRSLILIRYANFLEPRADYWSLKYGGSGADDYAICQVSEGDLALPGRRPLLAPRPCRPGAEGEVTAGRREITSGVAIWLLLSALGMAVMLCLGGAPAGGPCR
jgi:hypothetical protein